MGPVLKMWLCRLCGKPFQDSLKLLQHRRDHSTNRRYICHVGNCTQLFSTLTEYQVHRRRHLDNRLYCCRKCRVKFLTRQHLQYHKCGVRNLQCARCIQRFPSLFALRSHQRIKHSTAPNFSRRERKKLNVKIKFKDKYSAVCEKVGDVNKAKLEKDDTRDKDGNKILLKITAGKSTTIISPKHDRSIRKHTEKQKRKKYKKKQKSEKEKTRNGIILSIKNGSVNLPKILKADACERINGFPNVSTPVKQLSNLKLKIKTYPSIAVEQKVENKTLSSEVSNLSSPHSKSMTVSPEKLFHDGERTPNRKQLEEMTHISNIGESKVRNGIVIVKDKSGRLQAEQLQTAKLRKRDRDNVFDSLSDMHVGIWKVMPSPRTDNPSDVLKLRLSPQKPLRLDSGLDTSFESASASARYLDVTLKTRLYNSGDDSDVFDAGSVLDKDLENGGHNVNDSGIEVLSSSTVRSNGNSVRSVILDESSPNYLNTEDSLLSLDSPLTEAQSKSEHMLCPKCGSIVIETNNNTRSPGRCRCSMSNPNSPFQTPVSPLKMNIALIDSGEKQYSENKKKSVSPEQRKEFEVEKSSSPCLAEESSQRLPKTDGYKSDSDGSDFMMISLNGSNETASVKNKSSDQSEKGNPSLRLKIQLGSNPSALPVKKSPRKNSPDKRNKHQSPDYDAKSEDKQIVEIATGNDSPQSAKTIKQGTNSPGQLGLTVEPIDDTHDTEEEDASIEEGKKQTSEELFSLSREENHEHSTHNSSNDAIYENLKTECKGHSPTKHLEKISTNENHCSCGTSLQDSMTEKCQNCLNELPASCLSGDTIFASAETPQSEGSGTKIREKCTKKKPIFKPLKTKLNKPEDSKSAVVNNENEPSISKEIETNPSNGTKSKYKKPLFKKRTISADQDQSVRKTKKPLFKRTQSVVENGQSNANKLETDTFDRSFNGPFEDTITTAADLSDNIKIDSETVGFSLTQAIEKYDGEEIESKARNSKQEINVDNDANIDVLQTETVLFKDSEDKAPASVKNEPEDSLLEVLKLNPEETTPISPPDLHKAVATALNPFQQQFLSFLSCAKKPDSKGKNKKLAKRTNRKSVEKENICKTSSDVLEKNAVKVEKERKKKKQPTSDEEQNKAGTFSWLNIFSQANSEENETPKDLVPEIKNEVVDDFNVDLAAINQKMDTGEEEALDSFDDMFESKNLSTFQPLQNPKGTWTSKGSRHSVERRNSCKRKRKNNSNSDFSDNSSDGDTIDMYCCHKKHDPDFNPYMDSDDDDFMPSKPFKRRISTGRRAKRSQSIGSMSSDGDFKFTLDGKFEDTSSQASRSRRSKQGRKSCCPCCLGSFGDIEVDHLGNKPSYKLPRNYKQFVKSTLRLMQLQEKIHQLFISLFPDCIDLISKVKVGTEEFYMLIEDILYGLESQDVQFESGTISSDLPCTQGITQGILCQSEGSDIAGMFDEEIGACGIVNDQDKVGRTCTFANETYVTDHILKSCPTDLSNQKLLENKISDKPESGDHQNGLLNSGQSAVAEDENSVKCLKLLNQEKMTENETLKSDVNAQIVGASDQIHADNNYPQDSCVPLAYGDSHSVPLKDTGVTGLENSVLDMEHADHDIFDSALNGDDNFVDMNSEVPSQLQITIDLSAARVSVCREPKNCLQRLQGQLVKLVKYLLPDLDLKNYFFRNINNLEFLVELLIESNGNEFHEGMECASSPDHEQMEHSFHVNSVFDLKFENPISEETKAETLASITDDNGVEIPFEQRIKSQRESLKRDVFEFEEDDTAAMIKKSESVLSNTCIETLSKIATTRNVRTKSRETRLRKRTADEKRTLFVQEKVQNNHNSTIVSHSKTRKQTEPASRSKNSENSKQRFLSELNLGDKSDVTNSTESEVQKTDDVETPVSEVAADPKQDLEDLDSESRRKSGDKNIFELMQP